MSSDTGAIYNPPDGERIPFNSLEDEIEYLSQPILQNFNNIKTQLENIVQSSENDITDEVTDIPVQFSYFPDKENVYLSSKYEIFNQLWRTLYGCALLAYDIYEGKTVLIKINSIDISIHSRKNSLVFNDYFSECLILNYLYPNKICIKLIDEIKTKDWHIYITEYPERGDLYKFVLKHNGLCNQLNLLQKICGQLIEGIYDFHVNRYMAHFDLNPHNIYLTKKLDIKIIDFNQTLFSFSKHTGPVIRKVSTDNKGFTCQLVKKTVFPGLPSYNSPEIFYGQMFDAYANDIWALGILLFFIITGRTPFKIPDENNQTFIYIYTGEWITDNCQKLPWMKNIYRAYESIFRVIDKMLKPEWKRVTISEIKKSLC